MRIKEFLTKQYNQNYSCLKCWRVEIFESIHYWNLSNIKCLLFDALTVIWRKWYIIEVLTLHLKKPKDYYFFQIYYIASLRTINEKSIRKWKWKLKQLIFSVCKWNYERQSLFLSSQFGVGSPSIVGDYFLCVEGSM